MIKKECADYDNCSECPFNDDENGCALSNGYGHAFPCDWKID